MKLLIVSNYPWNKNNSFGKVFTDLFHGIEDLEILNIYCITQSYWTQLSIKYALTVDKWLLCFACRLACSPALYSLSSSLHQSFN